MRQYAPPPDVAALCARLREAGFPAYPVGGAVRDLVLGRLPRDWDVATAARPEEVTALFPAARPTGLSHGTVTLATCSREVEVTTFRRDGPYSDGRRPDYVMFVPDLTTDLARRDFTCNAMALDQDGGLIDPFGGAADIARRQLRCVGDPSVRLQEDVLRMLRAVRFCAQLDFDLGPAEQAVLAAHPQWVRRVSVERLRAELEQALLGAAPGRSAVFFRLGFLDHLPVRPCAPDLSGLAALPLHPVPRWAGLCHILMQCGGLDDPAEFLKCLHMERSVRRLILAELDVPENFRKN